MGSGGLTLKLELDINRWLISNLVFLSCAYKQRGPEFRRGRISLMLMDPPNTWIRIA